MGSQPVDRAGSHRKLRYVDPETGEVRNLTIPKVKNQRRHLLLFGTAGLEGELHRLLQIDMPPNRLFVLLIGVHDNLYLALFAFLVSFDHVPAYAPCW